MSTIMDDNRAGEHEPAQSSQHGADSESHMATPSQQSRTNPPETRRKRGRPPLPKTAVTGPKRPVGRPRIHPIKDPAAKRPVGRPRKSAVADGPRGGVIVRLLDKKLVVPGTQHSTSHSRQPNPFFSDQRGSRLPHPFAQIMNTEPECVAEPPLAAEPDVPRPDISDLFSDSLPPSHELENDADRAENDLYGLDGVGDGVGIDDEEDDDGDEDGEGPESRDGMEKKNLYPPPSWLMSKFHSLCKESYPAKCTKNYVPPLYRERKFYFPREATSFKLQRLRGSASPTDLYDAQFFLWDPFALLPEIACPDCSHKLSRHSLLKRPRRFVSFDCSVWLIGYRYQCSNCVNTKTGKKTVTFRSWDSKILNVLPPWLAAEFPARLTHRSGISKDLFSFMRSCIQYGVGSTQFSDILRIQHCLHYDELRLQYIEYIIDRARLSACSGDSFAVFPSFEDASDDGPYSYIPSGKWLRDVYDEFMQEHKHDIEQDMSLRQMLFASLDHTFKITKSSIAVLGERIFNALLTLTNQKKEIRMCALVATKSHAAFKEELLKVARSLKRYGHGKVEGMYTDTMADKAFLEQCFPELLDDVVPIEKYGDLEVFELPDNVIPLVKDTTQAINNAMMTILSDLPTELDEPDLVVGFDAEWNVSVSQDGSFSRGGIAVVQIAYKGNVYVLQLSNHLRDHRLPTQLVDLLASPRVRKVGRQVNSDLKQLHDAVRNAPDFVGGLDLALLAKERCIIADARVGLNDLCAAVLHLCLPKNVSERLDDAWENDQLTDKQIKYAACDAYASLLIYERLCSFPVPQPLPDVIAPDTTRSVLIYQSPTSRNSPIIARGELPSNDELAITPYVDGVKVTPSRIPVKILEVCIPGAILTSHEKRSLDSFGPPPFTAVCLRSHLKTFELGTNISPATESRNTAATSPMDIDTNSDVMVDDHMDVDLTSHPESEPGDQETYGSDGEDDTTSGTHSSLGRMIQDDAGLDLDPEELDQEAGSPPREHDPENQVFGNSVLDEAGEFDPSKVIRTRVMKDPFHVFNMLKLPVAHGLRKEFGRVLRDAIFVPDKEDVARISAWAAVQKPPLTFDQLRLTRSSWLWRRCRRHIPPPETLYPLVRDVFRTYGSLKDAQTSQPLFNLDSWQKTKNILKLIQLGHLSDIPGLSLYTQIGVDKKAASLPIYRCFRGTNAVEGGVHTYLRARLPGSGVSVKHLNSCLLDFVLVHNLKVGYFNSTGKQFQSHTNIWLRNSIQEKEVYLEECGILFRRPGSTRSSYDLDQVNGNLFIPTDETIGILRIPPDLRRKCGMAEFNPNTDQKQYQSYLACMQGTHKPIMPVHTDAEKDLFKLIVSSHPAFAGPGGPRWADAVSLWNGKADLKQDVYYKMVEQLKAYYQRWQKLVNVKKTLANTAKERAGVSRATRDPARSEALESIPPRQLESHSVTTGYNCSAADSTDNTSASAEAPALHWLPLMTAASPGNATNTLPSPHTPAHPVGPIASPFGSGPTYPPIAPAPAYPALSRTPDPSIIYRPEYGPPSIPASSYPFPSTTAGLSSVFPTPAAAFPFPVPAASGYPQPSTFTPTPYSWSTYPPPSWNQYPIYFGAPPPPPPFVSVPVGSGHERTPASHRHSNAVGNAPGASHSFSMPRAVAVAHVIAQENARPRVEKKPRDTRTCWKCGIEGCEGSKAARWCQNRCNQCLLRTCSGRRSATPWLSCPTVEAAKKAAKEARENGIPGLFYP